ncbi:MAG: hypothetical protein JXA71_18785 [Chitinispirillaceae bacterium]|nr:hypothetical protein [Chitinispirillaceae bacterium]
MKPQSSYRVSAWLIVSMMFLGCGGQKVLVPPKIDLKPFGTLGMVQFETNSKGNLAEYTSQRVLNVLQGAQPGIPVVEMGTMQNVLASVGRTEFDIEAIKLIAQKYGVGGIITGKLDVEKVKPSLSISSVIQELGVSAYVEASLSAKLLDAQNGATVWSNSAQGREKVASVGLLGGDVFFNAKDPEKAYGSLMKRLISVISDDFWAHRE